MMSSHFRGVATIPDIDTWALFIITVTLGGYNFPCKWMYGQACPEEVAAKVKDRIRDGIPEYIKNKIQGMNFHDGTSFTVYNKTSLTHPSWPTMHSSPSSLSLWLRVV